MPLCPLEERVRDYEFSPIPTKNGYVNTTAFTLDVGAPMSPAAILGSPLFRNQTTLYGSGSKQIRDWVIPKSERKTCWKKLKNPYRGYKDILSTTETTTISTPGLSYLAYWIRVESNKDRWFCWAYENRIGSSSSVTRNRLLKPLNEFTRPLEQTVTSNDIRAGFARLVPSAENLFDGVSLANFLFELKDLKSLLSLLRVPSDLKEATADKFVGTNFGALPFIGDIQKIVKSLDTVDAYLKKWNEMAAKEQIMDFHTTLWNFSGTDQKSATASDAGYFDTQIEWRQVVANVAKLHLYLKPLPIPESEFLRIKARNFGLDKPLSVIWEAIPFSWLVDYFLKIGNFIESFETSSSLFRFEIVDAGHSTLLKEECYSIVTGSLKTTLQSKPRVTWLYNPPVVWQERSTYTRTQIPVPSAGDFIATGPDWRIETSFASPHQAALALAVGWGMK
jgi:hypothetical protein